ncbi:MAG: amidohydrolase [Haliscomenobacter sp.]|nr:amidohydrolase [Haliscomenobacter sp.]
MSIKEHIRQLAREGTDEVVRIRRHLHRFPELSFKETETARFVCRALEKLDIPYQQGVGGAGVVALIEGLEPQSAAIALRADMDALPIQEENDTPYASAHPGIMHACGHDAHTASLLGTAAILNALKGQFKGTVKLIFQPGEELLPGGASLMIREGVLENPRPFSVFGQHVHPPLEAGKVGFRPGKYMASADELYVTVRGRGGHGALPHECVDPVVISAQIITALQQIVSRNANPIIPSVLTFGKIESAGGWTNIIPDSVSLMGTFRTLDEHWRFEAHKRMKRMAEGIAESMGGTCEFRIEVGYPFLYNDELLTAKAKLWAIDFLGADKVVDLPLRLSSEDFAFFSHELPSCFYRLGTGNPEKGITYPVHSSRFDIDEAALETGAGLMAWLAVCALGEGRPS